MFQGDLHHASVTVQDTLHVLSWMSRNVGSRYPSPHSPSRAFEIQGKSVRALGQKLAKGADDAGSFDGGDLLGTAHCEYSQFPSHTFHKVEVIAFEVD